MEAFQDTHEVKVNFLHPNGPANSFFFPVIEDHCILDISDVLLSVEPKLLQVEPTQSVKKKHSCQIKHWLAKNLDYNMQGKTLTSF